MSGSSVSIPIRWRRWPVIAVAVVAALLVLGRVGAGIVADYLWYDAMGASALWRERALLMTVICAGSALIAASILFVNLYVVRQSVVSLVLPRRVANIEIGEEVPGRYLVGVRAAHLARARMVARAAGGKLAHVLPSAPRTVVR